MAWRGDSGVRAGEVVSGAGPSRAVRRRSGAAAGAWREAPPRTKPRAEEALGAARPALPRPPRGRAALPAGRWKPVPGDTAPDTWRATGAGHGAGR